MHDCLEQSVDALHRRTRPGENRDHIAAADRNFDGVPQVLVADLLIVEIAFHESFIGVGGSFDQEAACLAHRPLEFLGNLSFDRLAMICIAVEIRSARQNIGDSAERLFCTYRQLQGTDSRPEYGLCRFDRTSEIRVVTVHLVDEENLGHSGGACKRPGFLAADFDAGRAVEHDHCGVDDGQRRLHLTKKVSIAWDIDDIDLAVVEFDRCER